MSEVVYVADHSPVLFLQGVAKAIRDGFYADETVQGAPFLNIVNEIRLVEGDEPEARHPELAEFGEINITAYDPTLYILDIQDAVLQGFDIVPETVQLYDLPYTVTLRKPTGVVLDVKPTVATTEVVEKPVEAPAAPQKGSKKPAKSKEL